MIRMIWVEIVTQIHLQQARQKEDGDHSNTLIACHSLLSKLSRVTSGLSAATMASVTMLSTITACEALFKFPLPSIALVNRPRIPRSSPCYCPVYQVDLQSFPWASSSLHCCSLPLVAAAFIPIQDGHQGSYQP